MEKNRSKVLMSILIIALCLAVCVGLTYAYFTDSAKSSGNKIQAGNLKLDLQLYDKTDGWHSIKDSQDPVFNYDKWEPGYVDVKLLKVENLGNLAMQWETKIVSTETISELANVIEVYVQTSNSEMPYPTSRAEALAWTKVGTLDQFINTTEKLASGTFTAQGEAYYISIALYMPAEITDNTLQEKVVGEFDIQINATQLAYESDAFDENYDTDAKLPCNHPTIEVIKGYDATYDTPGLTDGKKCIACNEILIEQEERDPIPYSKGLTFELVEDNENGNYYVVTGRGTCQDTNVIIPNAHKGENDADYIPVKVIGEYAFYADFVMTSVTMHDGITRIEGSAFWWAEMLTEIVFPDSLEYIGPGAFQDVTQVKELVFPDNVICIDSGAFHWDFLEHIVLGNRIERIAEHAFDSCNLKSITFKGTVEEWNNIDLVDSWDIYTTDYTIYCTDGEITKAGEVTYY